MKIKTAGGFTLIEMLIAAALSMILIVGILRLYLSTVNSYNTQDTITEMNQNAEYTCKRLSEEIMQAGTYLPDTGYTVIEMEDGKNDSITIRSNPTAAYHHFVVDVSNEKTVDVSNGYGFRGVTEIVKQSTTGVLSKLYINAAYAISPFQEGVNTESTPHQIRFTDDVSFNVGDIIFASKEHAFFKNGSNFCYGTADYTLAENIDSISIVLYDTLNTPTIIWEQMVYAKIYVRSQSAVPDNKYTHPTKNDHYRRYSQDMDVLLRKKVTF